MKKAIFYQKRPKIKQFSKLLVKLIVLISIISIFLGPNVSYGQTISLDDLFSFDSLPLNNGKNEILKRNDSNDGLPIINKRQPVKVVNMVITAYTSHINQTDDSPCITASGLDVCQRGAEDIVASNFNWLPFGTHIKIPELFGDRVFIIHDRMNSRYSQRVDVWMKSYSDAIKFGKKYAAVEIY
jgi:3D (Asp-Asp-Asp) domain-containing protein